MNQKIRKTIGIYSILLGISVIATWAVILPSGTIAEGRIELGFHLYAEFAMAVICLVSGVMLLNNRPFAVETNMGGLGMVTYSVLNAAGYYGERGETSAMIVFIILFVLTVTAISLHYVKVRTERTK